MNALPQETHEMYRGNVSMLRKQSRINRFASYDSWATAGDLPLPARFIAAGLLMAVAAALPGCQSLGTSKCGKEQAEQHWSGARVLYIYR